MDFLQLFTILSYKTHWLLYFDTLRKDGSLKVLLQMQSPKSLVK